MTPEEMNNLGQGCQQAGCAITMIVGLIMFFIIVAAVGC